MSANDWNFPFEGPLHEVFPALHEAQNAWLSQIDSLTAPDRKTHELIRMVCTVILRNPPGVRRHAMLAKELSPTTYDDYLTELQHFTNAAGVDAKVAALRPEHASQKMQRRHVDARERGPNRA